MAVHTQDSSLEGQEGQKRAAREEALVEALGQDGYNALMVKRQRCKARVALHRHRAAQARAE